MSLAYSVTQPTIKSKLISQTDRDHTLIIEPLAPGFGYTLGNSLRRIMLSSIPGFGITRVRINDITHEYQPLVGIVEDALEVILNLKLIRASILSREEKVTITLTKKGPGDVFARDFDMGGKVNIVNPDQYICSVDKDGSLQIELEISRGVGYLPVERINLANNINPHNILIDALFSPVTNVMMTVDEIRVGDMTNYNQLALSFSTDGSVSGQEVVDFTLSTVIDLFQKIQSSLVNGEMEVPTLQQAEVNVEAKVEVSDELSEKALGKKLFGILNKNGILTKTDLIAKQDELSDLPGIDEKMLDKLTEYLSK